uniref:Oxysterol-binding protein n=1 Tax=Palpitomonas bilix TaxID=652834 RepID=A0A7S3LT14_9EUKA
MARESLDIRDDDAAAGGEAVSGGFKYSKEEVKEQRKATLEFLKRVGKSLFTGKDLVSVSMPVTLFEPRSFLERVTDVWSFAPHYLRLANETGDKVERFKLIMAMAIASLRQTVIARKPFNPILGETFEASFEDGAQIFAEQTSHHPPVSHYEVDGPNGDYHIDGYAAWSASLKGPNSLKGHQTGPINIRLRDGTEYTYNLPYLVLQGIMVGTRVLQYEGVMKFRDISNNLECDLAFNPDKAGGFFKSLFSRKKRAPADTISGECKRGEETLFEVQGSWLSHLECNGKRYWTIDEVKKSTPTLVDNPLPSDCRYREDLIALKSGDQKTAQKYS